MQFDTVALNSNYIAGYIFSMKIFHNPLHDYVIAYFAYKNLNATHEKKRLKLASNLYKIKIFNCAII